MKLKVYNVKHSEGRTTTYFGGKYSSFYHYYDAENKYVCNQLCFCYSLEICDESKANKTNEEGFCCLDATDLPTKFYMERIERGDTGGDWEHPELEFDVPDNFNEFHFKAYKGYPMEFGTKKIYHVVAYDNLIIILDENGISVNPVAFSIDEDEAINAFLKERCIRAFQIGGLDIAQDIVVPALSLSNLMDYFEDSQPSLKSASINRSTSNLEKSVEIFQSGKLAQYVKTEFDEKVPFHRYANIYGETVEDQLKKFKKLYLPELV